MSEFNNKMVAVINKSLEPGIAMNALAHASIALGSVIGKENLQLVDYIDKDDHCFPNISKMPFIILRANSNKIRSLYEKAHDHNVKYTVFTDSMTVGSWQDQLSRCETIAYADHQFYGIVLHGDHELVKEWTKKFSLFK